MRKFVERNALTLLIAYTAIMTSSATGWSFPASLIAAAFGGAVAGVLVELHERNLR